MLLTKILVALQLFHYHNASAKPLPLSPALAKRAFAGNHVINSPLTEGGVETGRLELTRPIEISRVETSEHAECPPATLTDQMAQAQLKSGQKVVNDYDASHALESTSIKRVGGKIPLEQPSQSSESDDFMKQVEVLVSHFEDNQKQKLRDIIRKSFDKAPNHTPQPLEDTIKEITEFVETLDNQRKEIFWNFLDNQKDIFGAKAVYEMETDEIYRKICSKLSLEELSKEVFSFMIYLGAFYDSAPTHKRTPSMQECHKILQEIPDIPEPQRGMLYQMLTILKNTQND
ncbi:hypothetical protein PTTG_11943 [Puccinia triticina 1-1 BBBD Race 1]|uniref:Secreted protein n=1 Tax=Puccinia triticina (isolate 1-1 / race 1 (BBBD)) TaxID=630390 RepID=A0A180GIX6_PUCT1|nr:hypothetical protein PTTG_11943 [Puccinia triticina 1-1 BBBD Race 1]WAR55228.1 hypothetical protein PtB15_4B848 [Puccinia triticina]